MRSPLLQNARGVDNQNPSGGLRGKVSDDKRKAMAEERRARDDERLRRHSECRAI